MGGGQPKYKGTLAPGTMVQVEEHQVRVERYLSEGGYAHVYLTKSEKAIYPLKKGGMGDKGFTQHCLKRIAFEDDSVWTDVKKEIEVMVSTAIQIRNMRGERG
jgi:AP2-associated kinase